MKTDFRQTFLTEGVVHLPGALSQLTLDEAFKCWEWSIGHSGPTAARLFADGGAQPVDSLDTARSLNSDGPGFFYQDAQNPAAKEIYQSLVCRPDIQDAVELLFGAGQSAWYLGEQALLKDAGTPATLWHQDITDFRIAANTSNLVSLWIPFDPVSADTSLYVVRRSHKGPIYSSVFGQYRAGDMPRVEERPDEFDVVSYACEPGDVVAFHLAAVHGGAPTNPHQMRRTQTLRFFGEDAIYHSRLNPDHPKNGQPFRMPTTRQILPRDQSRGPETGCAA